MDRRGRPAPGRDHALQLEQHYDASGNLIEIISLDGGGKPMTDLFGNAVGKSRELRSFGNQVESTLHDEHGALTVGREGWSSQHLTYDRNGNSHETSVFDEAGRPTLHREGWHRVSYLRDSNGNVVSGRYWGVNGEPAMVNGCHEFRMERDDRGRAHTNRCIGPDGHPKPETSLGVPTWRQAYDEGDNVVEWTYLDAQGLAVNNSDGYTTAKR